MAENAKERVIRYLTDAHAAEVGAIPALKALADETTDTDVRAAATDHLAQSQSQADRLAVRITALGGSANAGKGVLNTLVAGASHLVNAFHDKEDKQTQDVIKSYSLEAFEVGMYTSLKAYANAVGDYETAQLAETIINEEQLAGERFLRLIPQVAVSAVAKTAPGVTA